MKPAPWSGAPFGTPVRAGYGRTAGAGLLAAALGALQTLGFGHHAALAWPLVPLAIAVLAAWTARAAPGRAAWLGWCFGTGWLAAGTWWLFVSMHRYGGLPAPLAAIAVLALAAALSLYLALAMALFARWRRGHAGADALLFAALWLLAELARGRLFTGFPWVATGYAFVDTPLAGFAPWVGVYGIGALVAGCAAGFGLAVAGSRAAVRQGAPVRAKAVAVALLISAVVGAAGVLLARQDHTVPAGTFRVSLLQTNVAQDEKFVTERLPQTLAWLDEALRAAGGDLVVAPETAVPLLPGQLDSLVPGYWEGLQSHFREQRRHALVGVPLGDYDSGYTNSVAGLGPGAPYRYDKQHLVPFGEFIPMGFRWFTELMNIPLGDFARGPLDAPSFPVGAQRVAPNVCYEDLFGEELAVRFADASRAPTVLANVSNIGWFGDTVALPQHLAISRLRTLELQRPMLRATNTGVTAAIDHRARVLAALPPFTAGTLTATVEGRIGVTPYAAWAGRHGLWPAVALALVVIGACAFSRRRAPS